ncbi:P-loop containing nucleoside triphosphate hydrolase protein [Chaetomium strumarium]|uniref:P-loop containing nucleoside triphosphate hydrolase protein n=1 Tax=Chaetomium strumarium TaxID=1170767 RepID=A0AAJ0H3X0_9PEZI|nr:P-loop containing nucleoside triphosphate hydrolase protein [Chaetomium strumarium]
MPRCWPFRTVTRSKQGAGGSTKSGKLSSTSGSTISAEADSNTKKEEKKDEKKDGENKEEKKAEDKSDDKKVEKEGDESKDESKDENDDEKEKEKPKVPVGSVSEIKNIYKGASDDDGNWTWVDKYPDDVEEAAENEETATYAVVVRNQKSNDSRKKLEAHSIVVQSPQIRAALAEIMADYPGVACELTRLEFEAPFQPFVHRWAEFTKYLEKPDLDEKTKEHMKLLYDILNYEIGDNIRTFQDYVKNGVVSFKDLWMIFQPGNVVISAHGGPLSAFEMVETEYMANQCGKFLQVRCDCVDYGGKDFGRYQEAINIPEFLGTKKITGLKVYPLHFHEEREAVAAKLIKRGEMFQALAGHHYKQYSGKAITWNREGQEVECQISGRIVVDIDSFNRFSPWRVRYLNDWNANDLDRFSKHKEKMGLTDEKFVLPPYYQMLARSRTRGYSLKFKKWLDFFVEQITEVQWNSNAFERLVLPPDQKELILAFSESQLAGSNFDDVIQGKGKGIICLLSGPPGVGKTLTAEAVAESLKVPLHSLSSGDLGSDPWELERELSSILELVARWNAILLLDECDVFLEARSTHELERNKIVSIFLRTLEYYEGIMFMTTNRVEDIDAAFQSRIHVSIEYPDLTAASRRTIWANFLKGSTIKSSLTDKDIAELAELKLNGRQIKNVLKTAQLLASRRKSSTLDREYIETVLIIEKKRPGAPQQMMHYL